MYIGMTEAYQRRAGHGADGHQLFRGHPRHAGGAAVDARGRRGPDHQHQFASPAGCRCPSSAPIARRNTRWRPTARACATRLRPSASTSRWSSLGRFPPTCWRPASRPRVQDVLACYGELGGVPDAMIAGFADMLASDEAPDPQLVVDAYLALADAPRASAPRAPSSASPGASTR